MDCGQWSTAPRRTKSVLTKHLVEDYIFHKQTYQELAHTYGKGRRVLKRLLSHGELAEKKHDPRPLHLALDATYFGERKEGKSWCVLVARDPKRKENLVWQFTQTETTLGYALLREELEDLGYQIRSVTGDGFSGIRSAFHSIPFQMCQVHMERLVIEGTTRNPLTEAGQVLLALTRSLPRTHSHLFTKRLQEFRERYALFLSEKTIHPVTGEWSYTHEGVRSAYLSLERLRRYLFTYEHDKRIPKTTNSLEGHFRHLKRHLGAHGGLTRKNQQNILAAILQASSVAPGKNVLGELWK